LAATGPAASADPRSPRRVRARPSGLEPDIKPNVIVPAIGVVRRISRIDETAAGLEDRFVRIGVEDIFRTDLDGEVRIDLIGRRQIEQGQGFEFLEDQTCGVARRVGPIAIVACARLAFEFGG
jgi:hypothetical protein